MQNRLITAVCLLLLWPSAGAAQNREHLQMTADLRILEGRVNRLQLSVNRLDAQIADTNKRLDAATAASVKGFADQQLLISQLTTTITSIRERLDDNSVRVSQLSQEFTAIREGVRRLTDQINTLVGLLQPAVDAAAPPATGQNTPTAPPAAASAAGPDGQPAAGPAPLNPVVLPQSASYIFQQAMNDYSGLRYDSAIEGFREVIATYPDSPDAAEAQYWIGQSYNTGKKDCRSALPEYQKFVDTYKDSRSRAEGIYMIGFCYQDLGQRTNAQQAYQQVIKEYPSETWALMARQRLEGMGVKPQ